jgi:outer membrane protein assembly factor BamD
MITKTLKLLFIFIVSLTLFSCASEEKLADTPEAAFALAQDFEKSDRNQIAIQRYMDVKNKYPYSSLATEAELAIADVYFKTEDFTEAQISYQNFKEFHPKHSKIDYVIFRIGLSYYQQLPDSIDRDLSLANDAIYAFNELIKKYPNSTYKAEAEDYRKKAFVMLNEKELYIADFYFQQKLFDSAFNRYEMSYKKFSGFGLDARSVAGAVRSARELNDFEKEKRYLDILNSKFSDSKEAQDLKRGGKTE